MLLKDWHVFSCITLTAWCAVNLSMMRGNNYTLMSKNCKSQKSKIIITVQRRAFVFYCKSSPKLSKLMSILVTAAEEHSGFASFGKQLKWYTQAIAYFYFL